jgi:hypothetical protein
MKRVCKVKKKRVCKSETRGAGRQAHGYDDGAYHHQHHQHHNHHHSSSNTNNQCLRDELLQLLLLQPQRRDHCSGIHPRWMTLLRRERSVVVF